MHHESSEEEDVDSVTSVGLCYLLSRSTTEYQTLKLNLFVSCTCGLHCPDDVQPAVHERIDPTY